MDLSQTKCMGSLFMKGLPILVELMKFMWYVRVPTAMPLFCVFELMGESLEHSKHRSLHLEN